MRTLVLSGSLFAGMIRGGAEHLGRDRGAVNDLNVFPIPDGDTGDNMFMTVNAGASALPASFAGTLEEAASVAARGMLLGARGNSGVILSRIFSGIAHGFRSRTTATVGEVGKAFRDGITEAYGAVSVPVEGTILTVYREAVEYAESRTGEDPSLEEYFEAFLGELRRSLERTPELLDVLREAGVVDSGGAGLVSIAEGMYRVLLGEEISFDGGAEVRTAPSVDLSSFGEDSVLTYGYCTEFLLRLQRAKGDPESFDLPGFVSFLEGVGDSVAAFREGSIVKVHVHTKVPGEVLNEAQRFGEFLTLKIENMTLQHNETVERGRENISSRPAPHKRYGIVAVAAGEGLKDTFRALGVDEVVEGGQSMNPSAEEFVRAFRRINADVILVFPNNGNVLLTARQAAELYPEADVRVLPSRTVGEGYAAISMLDTDCGEVDELIAGVNEVISGVETGMVSRAVRDTERGGVKVRRGDYIGFVGEEIYVDRGNAADALYDLAQKRNAGSRDILLLLCGADADAAESRELCDRLTAAFRRTEVIMIDGGQPVYEYILVLE